MRDAPLSAAATTRAKGLAVGRGPPTMAGNGKKASNRWRRQSLEGESLGTLGGGFATSLDASSLGNGGSGRAGGGGLPDPRAALPTARMSAPGILSRASFSISSDDEQDRFVAIKKGKVRAGPELDSELVGELLPGTEIVALEITKFGMVLRVRFAGGWVSMQSSKTRDVLLLPMAVPGASVGSLMPAPGCVVYFALYTCTDTLLCLENTPDKLCMS